MSKVTSMADAISRAVEDDNEVYLGGFTHLIPFAAGHEIIRQERSGLTLYRATPDLIFDQMIAAGCAERIVFSWAGNPGVGSLPCFRRACEDGVPNEIEIEEYTHFGFTARIHAGATNMPFVPVRTFAGSDLPEHTDAIRTVEDPYTGEDVYVVPPMNPDVAVVRAQRADEDGNAHIWGIQGEMREAAFAADRVVLSVEEIVDERVIRSDPNRTVISADAVDHVVEEPYGSHPSYAQGYYDRDNDAYIEWSDVASTPERVADWLDEWVYGVDDRTEYVERLSRPRMEALAPQEALAEAVNVGRY